MILSKEKEESLLRQYVGMIACAMTPAGTNVDYSDEAIAKKALSRAKAMVKVLKEDGETQT